MWCDNTITFAPNICRLCASVSEVVIPMFGKESDKERIDLKIKKCLPIVVREEDCKPKQVCFTCVSKLEVCMDLVEQCLAAEFKFESVLQARFPVLKGTGVEATALQNDVDPQKNGIVHDTGLGVVPLLASRPTRVWPEDIGKTDQNAGNTLTVQHDGSVIVLSKVDAEAVGQHSREDCQDILLMVELKYKDVPESQQSTVAKAPAITYSVEPHESIVSKSQSQSFSTEANKVHTVTFTNEVPTVSTSKAHTLSYTIEPQSVSSSKTYTLTYATETQPVTAAKTQTITYTTETQPINVSKIQTFSYTTDAINKPQTMTYTAEPHSDSSEKAHALVYTADQHPVSLSKTHSMDFTGELQPVALTKSHMLSYASDESPTLTSKTLLAYTAEHTTSSGTKSHLLTYTSEQVSDASNKTPTLAYTEELQPNTLATKADVLCATAEVQPDTSTKNATLVFPSESEEVLGLESAIPQQTTILIDTNKYKAAVGGESISPPRPEKPFPCTECGKSFMRRSNLNAHMGVHTQSEYVASHDLRRGYISGFSGSAGDAVITLDSAALWTDSRYYLQAENQLDCNWILMKSGYSDVPSIQEWLLSQIHPGDLISADPRIISYTEWTNWDNFFSKAGLKLELYLDNLVDKIWGSEEGRPPYPSDPLFILDTAYAGLSWQEKIAVVRQSIDSNKSSVLVLTALDEIAWLLNLRGADVPFTPVFQSYLIVGTTWATLYLPPGKSTAEVVAHLNANGNNEANSVRIKNYTDIWNDLQYFNEDGDRVWLPYPFSYARGASYLIYKMVPEGKAVFSVSPVLLMKDRKSDIEAKGMQNAHIRDAVALCQFLSILEEGVAAGEIWDELSAVSTLQLLRTAQSLSLGPSFGTIAAFGPNAALPHYEPTFETNRVIDDTSVFMLDSGGQYLDGTTDVTRTIHLGTPTNIEREIYTNLLMGCIDIASTIFPEGQTLSSLEILIRAPLYSLGLNYGHGSTHGIGFCLAVHEAFNTTYHEHFFGSQEPGYYQENEFGIRLENIVTVVKANVTLGSDPNYLTFKPVTLVPYDSNLINPDIMSKKQLLWLNDYHAKVREIIGAEMLRQGLTNAYEWLLRNTEPIHNISFESCIPQLKNG